jgi:hypothetical protein
MIESKSNYYDLYEKKKRYYSRLMSNIHMSIGKTSKWTEIKISVKNIFKLNIKFLTMMMMMMMNYAVR